MIKAPSFFRGLELLRPRSAVKASSAMMRPMVKLESCKKMAMAEKPKPFDQRQTVPPTASQEKKVKPGKKTYKAYNPKPYTLKKKSRISTLIKPSNLRKPQNLTTEPCGDPRRKF